MKRRIVKDKDVDRRFAIRPGVWLMACLALLFCAFLITVEQPPPAPFPIESRFTSSGPKTTNKFSVEKPVPTRLAHRPSRNLISDSMAQLATLTTEEARK